MTFFEKTESSERIFEGKIVGVRRDRVVLSDGRQSIREVVDHPGGVCIAAVDENRCIYIVEQFRYPLGEIVTELPAGKLEYGEQPLPAAVRELREETGLTAQHMEFAGVLYPTPGYCTEKLYLYFASGLTAGEQQLDEGELLHCKKIPLADAVGRVLDNTIKDGKSMSLILLADRKF